MSGCGCKDIKPVGNAASKASSQSEKSNGIPWYALIVGGLIGFLGVKAIQKRNR